MRLFSADSVTPTDWPNVGLPHPKRLEAVTYRLTFHAGRLEEVDLGKGDFDYKEIEDSPCFIISDNGQMLLLLHRDGDDGKPYAMWTNYLTLVQSFRLLFDLLWAEKSVPHEDVTELPELPAEAL